jgi:hypothetical protein
MCDGGRSACLGICTYGVHVRLAFLACYRCGTEERVATCRVLMQHPPPFNFALRTCWPAALRSQVSYTRAAAAAGSEADAARLDAYVCARVDGLLVLASGAGGRSAGWTDGVFSP